jgi:hypothetical protein
VLRESIILIHKRWKLHASNHITVGIWSLAATSSDATAAAATSMGWAERKCHKSIKELLLFLGSILYLQIAAKVATPIKHWNYSVRRWFTCVHCTYCRRHRSSFSYLFFIIDSLALYLCDLSHSLKSAVMVIVMTSTELPPRSRKCPLLSVLYSHFFTVRNVWGR